MVADGLHSHVYGSTENYEELSVRIAISTVAAVSGLVLLGLGLYGQPAAYLRLAKDGWDVLMDHPTTDWTGDQAHDAEADRVALLQQEVTRLESELAAQQIPTPRPDGVAVRPQLSAPAADTPPATTTKPATAGRISEPAASMSDKQVEEKKENNYFYL
jgi:hypothetical protein